MPSFTRILIQGQNGEALGSFTYGQAAKLYKINKGWNRRSDRARLGFQVNPLTGAWVSGENDEEPRNNAPQRQEHGPVQTIVPYVQDTRNILIFQPATLAVDNVTFMATIQAALKVGITRAFQVEDSEIAVEPLPDMEDRRCLLIYEASEGGAGVLHSLVENPKRLAQVAEEALIAMHYAVQAGELTDTEEDKELSKRCNKGCYRCLLSYTNQMDHGHIDRHNEAARTLLLELLNARYGPQEPTMPEQEDSSDNPDTPEKRWKRALDARELPEPEYHVETLGMHFFAYFKEYRIAIFLGNSPGNAGDLDALEVHHITFPHDETAWPSLFDELQNCIQ